jgi:hypothetical protein
MVDRTTEVDALTFWRLFVLILSDDPSRRATPEP